MTVWIPRPIRSAARLVRSRDARQNALHEWRRQLGGEPALPERPIGSVLVLCHGNICRSPFAEAWLARARPDLAIRSAGLAAGDGAPADPTAARVARKFGVDLTTHRSRPVDAAELAATDLVLVMEAAQAARVAARSPEAAACTRLLGDFLDPGPFGIPDPWGEPEDVFARVFARIVEASDRLAARLAARPA